jgi:hypothetical protein
MEDESQLARAHGSPVSVLGAGKKIDPRVEGFEPGIRANLGLVILGRNLGGGNEHQEGQERQPGYDQSARGDNPPGRRFRGRKFKSTAESAGLRSTGNPACPESRCRA